MQDRMFMGDGFGFKVEPAKACKVCTRTASKAIHFSYQADEWYCDECFDRHMKEVEKANGNSNEVQGS